MAPKRTPSPAVGRAKARSAASGRATSRSSSPADAIRTVFAYGTLRGDFSPDGDRWGVLKRYGGSWELGKARGFRLYQREGMFYPFAVHTGKPDDVLVGTVLQFPSDDVAKQAIESCNQIESFDPKQPKSGLYQRIAAQVQTDAGQLAQAFVYHQPMNDGTVKAFASGDWFESRTEAPKNSSSSAAQLDPETTTSADSSGRRLPETNDDGQRLIATFGFGSNSVRQLRGRLGDDTLQGYPAKVPGQVLAFAGPNKSWAHDPGGSAVGTATLVPASASEASEGVALGTVAFLTEELLATLDGYEGVPTVYDRRKFKAQVLYGGACHDTEVTAYVKVNSSAWYPPSEAYLCAVLRNVSGSFPHVGTLNLRDTKGRIQSQWIHPGFPALGLGAFLFELGVRKSKVWELPYEIGRRKEALDRKGIGTVEALLASIRKNLCSDVFDKEELLIARTLLDCSSDLHEDDDDAQAERWLETD